MAKRIAGRGKSVATALLDKMIDAGAHFDSWTNMVTGMGTERDKTQGTTFLPTPRLPDETLTAMYRGSDLAAKIVNVYPREEMRPGFEIGGVDLDEKAATMKYLRQFNIPSLFTDVRIWARLFGGAAIWIVTDDTVPATPLPDSVKTVQALRVIDRRFLYPLTYYTTGPKTGKPETYMLTAISNFVIKVGAIHESRLIIFPGARTDERSKIEFHYWDDSILQAPYEALRASGNVWKSIETLVADGNQYVYYIKGFINMMAQKTGKAALERLGMIDFARSVHRAIVLDADAEKAERQQVAFSGLADLDDRALQRVASAAEIPVTVLMGQAPAGLNATGNADLQWFWSRVHTERVQIDEPRLRRLLEIIFNAKDSPIKIGSDFDVIWPPLWEPTATEAADIRLKQAQTDHIYITDEVVLPEEIAVSRFPASGWSAETTINVEARESILESDIEKLLERPDPPAPILPGAPNAPPNPAEKDPNEPGNGAGGP